jgi:hypothetical protein
MSDSILFDVPNLDDLSVDPEDSRRAARVMRALANYLDHKRCAMKYRVAGKIEEASAHENTCDRIYRALPGWARW